MTAPKEDQAAAQQAPTAPRGRCRGVLGGVLFWVAAVPMTAWAVLAIYWSNLPGWLRPVGGAAFGLGMLGVLLFLRPRWRGRLVFGLAWAAVLGWWLTIPPSNSRDWQPDVAVLPYAEIAGNRITIHNIRNCGYRTETDYDVRHYDKTFDLDKLRTVDLYLVYWGSPNIAHTMVSFGFEGGDHVCISIETRKEKGEVYSAIKGFFRQYELTYIIADERDLVRVRTNYRQGEEVYLYRLDASPEAARALLLSYLERANRLRDHPEWYNALTSNCTTNIRVQADEARGHRSPLDWRIILNGHSDEMLYERGRIATNLPFGELRQRCHINSRARAADKAVDFSGLIRQGVPVPNQ